MTKPFKMLPYYWRKNDRHIFRKTLEKKSDVNAGHVVRKPARREILYLQQESPNSKPSTVRAKLEFGQTLSSPWSRADPWSPTFFWNFSTLMFLKKKNAFLARRATRHVPPSKKWMKVQTETVRKLASDDSHLQLTTKESDRFTKVTSQ